MRFDDPIDNIEWHHFSKLHANWWNPNRVFKDEFTLLERSLLDRGWTQPILVNSEFMIIDGFHRWRLSQDSDKIKAKYSGHVPCAIMDVDQKTAMVNTVRMNRAKGAHIAVNMRQLVSTLVNELGCEQKWVAKEIGASPEEIALLCGEDIFSVKRIQDWAYSEAWYPERTNQVEESASNT